MDYEEGFRTREVCEIAGVTYRECDYWTIIGLVTPSIEDGRGTGNHRLYDFADIVCVAVIKRLTAMGMTPEGTRKPIEKIRRAGSDRPRVFDFGTKYFTITVYLRQIEKEVLQAVKDRGKKLASIPA